MAMQPNYEARAMVPRQIEFAGRVTVASGGGSVANTAPRNAKYTVSMGSTTTVRVSVPFQAGEWIGGQAETNLASAQVTAIARTTVASAGSPFDVFTITLNGVPGSACEVYFSIKYNNFVVP